MRCTTAVIGMVMASGDLTERSLVDRCVPQGWKLVPLEPTDAMLMASARTAGMKAVDDMVTAHQLRSYTNRIVKWPGDDAPIIQAYRAMLAAAPEAPREAVCAEPVTEALGQVNKEQP